jgi:hypothetical protein
MYNFIPENLITFKKSVHGTLPYLVAYYKDKPLTTMNNVWTDSGSASIS